ncbi:hypothetical protein OG592_37405 [Streptomyces avidinii]|uniref:hypothetical protein n=1 Tax=Streptomyces avidinii TaxID=1895 RepID=UPI0038685422|nr:hypothetical protein OG592_37405 [Streptomyces avidinii]
MSAQVAVLIQLLDHPEFEGSTHSVLGNPPVRTCVGQAVQEHLETWLEEHPEQASALVGRIQGTLQH